jgi:hypothetical protein
MRDAINACCLIAGMLLLSLAIARTPSDAEQCSDVNFQIVPDKKIYRPGARMSVKFIVENTGELPLYLFRNLSQCSSQIGSYFLTIHDQTGRVVNQEGCSLDMLWDKVDVVQELTDTKLGIQLRQHEIFGSEGSFKLPAKKGTYRLEGVLLAAGYTPQQKAALSEKQMRVLQNSCSAPVMTITIK